MDIVGQTSGIGDAPWWSGAGYGIGGGRFADFGSNAVRINAAERASAVGFENLLDQNQFASTNKNITDCCNRALDQGVNSEFRMSDRLRDVEREMAANAREAAKCCCDLAKQACEDKAEILAAVAASEARGVERQLNATQAELISLKTQVACGCCGSSSQG